MTQTTQMITTRDLAGVPIYTPYPSNTVYDGLFSMNVAQSVTAPNDWSTFEAIFSCSNGANFKVSINATPVFPTGAMNNTNGFMNIPSLVVNAGDVLNFIADQDGTKIGVTFRGLASL